MAPKGIVFSNYQLAIFNDVAKGSGHTIVEAVPGSGKSFSLIESVKYLPPQFKKRNSSLMLAFNTEIAKHLREKNPSYIKSVTSHSLGYQAIRESAIFGKETKLNPIKTYHIICRLVEASGGKKSQRLTQETIESIQRIVSLCKSYLIDTPSKIDGLIDKFDIDTGFLGRESAIKMVCAALRIGAADKKIIDYDDMIYYAITHNLLDHRFKFDRIFCDEIQDFSSAQVTMLLSICANGGRILACGDPNQAIYSWRGADLDTIDMLTKKLNAKTLPLNFCYRCPKRIVALAQTIVPHIQWAPGAKDGKVETLYEDNFLSRVKPRDVILSRFNAPLVGYCLALLRQGKRASIKGRDISFSLSFMIKKSGASSVKEFLGWVGKLEATEIKRLEEKGRDTSLMSDKISCLRAVCREADSLTEVMENIKKLFAQGENEGGIVLSSIHRFKGQQAERVFVLYNTLDLNGGQEDLNLAYISFSRSLSELYLVK